jgi:DNA invertase Pin-like site-specific DNA recombinase
MEKKYNISSSFISSINNGIYFKDDNEIYPLYKYYKFNEDYDELIDLLLNSPYSLSKIAEILGIGYSTVKKINEGKMRKGLYPTYPIRKKTAYE